MEKINIIVVGASGKMGQAIIKETLDDSDLNLAMAVDIKTSPRIGKDAGELLGFESNIKISSDLIVDKAQPDILIDFTRPEASMKYLEFCEKNHERVPDLLLCKRFLRCPYLGTLSWSCSVPQNLYLFIMF